MASTNYTKVSINSTNYARVAVNSTNWVFNPIFRPYRLLLESQSSLLLENDFNLMTEAT